MRSNMFDKQSLRMSQAINKARTGGPMTTHTCQFMSITRLDFWCQVHKQWARAYTTPRIGEQYCRWPIPENREKNHAD